MPEEEKDQQADQQAEFDAGFNRSLGIEEATPDPDPNPEPEPEPDIEEDPEDPEPPEKPEAAPPPVNPRLDPGAWEQRRKSIEGRIRAQQKGYESLIGAYRRDYPDKPLPWDPTPERVKRDEDVDYVKKNLPEVQSALEKVREEERERYQEELAARDAELQQLQTIQAQAYRDELFEAHPDAAEFVEDPDAKAALVEWISSLPYAQAKRNMEVLGLAQDSSGEYYFYDSNAPVKHVIKALTDFKDAVLEDEQPKVAETPAVKTKKALIATEVKASGRPPPKEAPDPNDDKAFERGWARALNKKV